MTKIIERLRAHKVGVRWKRGIDTDYPLEWEPHALCAEAADEIEALRSQLERECHDTDAILRALGLDPDNCRTDGGSLKMWMLLGAIEHRDVMLKRADRAERAWLVEWRFNGIQWLYLWPRGAGGFSFTGDADKAIRFARRDDAEAALQWARDTDSRRGAARAGGEFLVTEHEWPNAELTGRP